MSKQKRRKMKAFYNNANTYYHYLNKLKLISENMFKWSNLPDGLTERWIERTLFHYGEFAFHKDNMLGLMGCNNTMCDTLNNYGEPIAYRLYGINYQSYKKTEDLVIVRNNFESVSTISLINKYINDLYELDRSISVNIQLQKTPCIIICDEENKLTLENLLEQYDGNIPFIFGNKSISNSLEGIKSIPIKADFVADRLQQHKTEIWNECLSTIGINNANINKRERLNSEEVNSNNQLLRLMQDVFLSSRQTAVKEINEKFGTNITVELREELKEFNWDGEE